MERFFNKIKNILKFIQQQLLNIVVTRFVLFVSFFNSLFSSEIITILYYNNLGFTFYWLRHIINHIKRKSNGIVIPLTLVGTIKFLKLPN